MSRRAQEQLQLVNDVAKQSVEALAPVVAPPKAEGQTVTYTLNYDVTDVWELLRHNPGLVEVTPRRREILEFLNRLAEATAPLLPSVPGLTVRREVKSGTRQSKPQKAIEV